MANEFIDKYMASANGEYVKVYLYLLRHREREVEVAEVADALNHTESDIKRAVAYWVRQGVLIQEEGYEAENGRAGSEDRNRNLQERPKAETAGRQQPSQEPVVVFEDMALPSAQTAASPDTFREPANQRPLYTPEQVGRLAGEEEFTQLLYISQKYMNKVFTPRECEVFAYLYDALHMPAELLEYLVEYCVQGGHYSIRYLESVALNWHEKGIVTVDMAKEYTSTFSKEGFAVMKAFGISDRRPGDSEQAMIRKWFREYGFTKDIVLEACGRTLKAIHKPSFSYADKILSDWKKGGVRVLADVGRMDEKRDGRKNDKGTGAVKPAKNQFHNFEQRGTNYDAMVLERLKERLEDKK